jgi:aspartate 4-decarboxylase
MIWIKDKMHPLDILSCLAEDHGVVVADRSVVAATNSSARVPFANLSKETYSDFGCAVRSIAWGYVQANRAAKGGRIAA